MVLKKREVYILPAVTPTHEQDLLFQTQAGNEKALQELVLHYVKQISAVARKYTPPHANEQQADHVLNSTLTIFERTVRSVKPYQTSEMELLIQFTRNANMVLGKQGAYKH
jgi:hypothetical protein